MSTNLRRTESRIQPRRRSLTLTQFTRLRRSYRARRLSSQDMNSREADAEESQSSSHLHIWIGMLIYTAAKFETCGRRKGESPVQDVTTGLARRPPPPVSESSLICAWKECQGSSPLSYSTSDPPLGTMRPESSSWIAFKLGPIDAAWPSLRATFFDRSNAKHPSMCQSGSQSIQFSRRESPTKIPFRIDDASQP